MFTKNLFHLIYHLLGSRWVRDYAEQHGACEDSYTARLGPLHLAVNECFVLDHTDAALSLRLPTPWGTLHLGYLVCRGEEAIRTPGCYAHWQRPAPHLIIGRGQEPPHRPLPF